MAAVSKNFFLFLENKNGYKIFLEVGSLPEVFPSFFLVQEFFLIQIEGFKVLYYKAKQISDSGL